MDIMIFLCNKWSRIFRHELPDSMNSSVQISSLPKFQTFKIFYFLFKIYKNLDLILKNSFNILQPILSLNLPLIYGTFKHHHQPHKVNYFILGMHPWYEQTSKAHAFISYPASPLFISPLLYLRSFPFNLSTSTL